MPWRIGSFVYILVFIMIGVSGVRGNVVFCRKHRVNKPVGQSQQMLDFEYEGHLQELYGLYDLFLVGWMIRRPPFGGWSGLPQPGRKQIPLVRCLHRI
jgi:hypothetical protein